MSPAHAAVLTMLRTLTRPYTSSPLPEWETFAQSTRFFGVDARTELPTTERDIFVVVRGITKLVHDEPGPSYGKVAEFFEAPGVMAPGLRPFWATRASTPLSLARWRSRQWAVPKMTLHTIERSHLLWFDYRVVERLAAQHPAWGEMHSAFLWTYVEGLFSGGQAMREKDIEGRYRELVTERSSLVRRVSQRDLASYLGITDSALSRIAKRVREDPNPPAESVTARVETLEDSELGFEVEGASR